MTSCKVKVSKAGSLKRSQEDIFCCEAEKGYAQIILYRGPLYYQPKHCTIMAKIPQNHHTFALFDPSNMGNLTTPISKHLMNNN